MINPLCLADLDVANPNIQAMRRRLLKIQIGYIEQYLKPFDKANYIDSEIMRIRDIVQKAKDW